MVSGTAVCRWGLGWARLELLHEMGLPQALLSSRPAALCRASRYASTHRVHAQPARKAHTQVERCQHVMRRVASIPHAPETFNRMVREV